MPQLKRQKRRNRHQLKQRLRELDAVASKQIHRSFNLSINYWGGTRCPGCGINIRPHQLLNADFSRTYYDEEGKWAGHISGHSLPCDKVKKCPGERDWN